MKTSKAMVAVEIAILIVVLAVTVPRVISQSRASTATQEEIERGSAAMEFARQRLWGDFMDSRAEPFPDHKLPAPSLEQYMFFLIANGLYKKGDRVVIPILPAIHPDKSLDRLRVGLEHTTLPIRLGISLQSLEKEYNSVGKLEVFVESNGSLELTATRTEPTHSLLSYWPVMPRPILP